MALIHPNLDREHEEEIYNSYEEVTRRKARNLMNDDYDGSISPAGIHDLDDLKNLDED